MGMTLQNKIGKLSIRLVTLNLAFLYLALSYLNFAYANIVLILTIAFLIVSLIINPKSYILDKKQGLFLFILLSPLLLTFISVLQSHNFNSGLPYLIQRLPLVVISLVFLTQFNTLKDIESSIMVFIVLSVLAVLYTFFKIYTIDPSATYNVNPEISKITTQIQHTYFGTFLVLALLFLLHLFNKRWPKILIYGIGFILVYGIWLSTARLAYLQLIFVLGLIVYFRGKLRSKLLLLGFIIAGLFLILNSDGMRQKFQSALSIKDDPRTMIWNNALEVIKHSEKPLLGTGIGDYYTQKYDTYWLKGDVIEAGEDYHGCMGYEPHNQYLDFLLFNGIIGLIFLISMLYLGWQALKTNDYFILALTGIPLINMLTDSILMRQWGVILYAVILSLVSAMIINHRRKD